MSSARPRRAAAAALIAALGTPVAQGYELRRDDDFASAREAMDPVRWLLAQAAPASPAPSPAPSSPAEGLDSPSWTARIFPFIDSSEPVGFAPARWGGTVALEYLSQRAEERRRQLLTGVVQLTGASYFWQPWFAQVQGSLTVLGSAEKGDGLGPANAPAGFTPTATLSGGGTLTVFPSSRFPFVASLDSTDSRATGEFTPSDYRSTRGSLRQSYRNPLGTETYIGSFDFSALSSNTFGRDTVAQLEARYLGTLDPHRMDAALTLSRSRQDAGAGAGSDIVRAFGTHLYTPSPDLWVNSLANFTQTGIEVGDAGAGFTQRLGQLSSQAVWRPEFDERLVLTGGGRLFVNQFVRGAQSTAHSLSGNVGASFALTEEATLNASLSATGFGGTGADSTLVTFESAGANYVSRPFDLGLASYSFSAALQGGHQSGGPEETRTVASAQADQQLSRTVALGDAASVNLMVTQGGGVTEDTFLGRTDTLRAGASAGLRVASSEGSDAYFGTSYAQSDSRGGFNDRFRLVNVQASGQVRFGPYDSLSANVTAQWVRSNRDLLPVEEVSRQVYGGVSYQHTRLFGVPRLRYLLSATFNEGIQTDSRLLGDVDAKHENVTQLVDSRLLYDIGRLELRVGTRFAKVDGRGDLQWYLRIYRQIGQY